MKIKVCIPSYRRPKVETLAYLPRLPQVYVDEGERDEYVRANKGHEKQIIAVPKGVQGNLCRIRNYILDKEFEAGADVVVIIDDDMRSMQRRVPGDVAFSTARRKISEDELEVLIEKYSIICDGFGFKFWGVNCVTDTYGFMQYTPFSTTKYIGGPFQAFLKGNECRYDERLPLKEDYDMTLQQCNRYRGCLRVNSIIYYVRQSEQAGGCAMYRNYIREEEQLKMLQAKWGKDIVHVDKRDNRSSRYSIKHRDKIDYNPIIKIPIKGV